MFQISLSLNIGKYQTHITSENSKRHHPCRYDQLKIDSGNKFVKSGQPEKYLNHLKMISSYMTPVEAQYTQQSNNNTCFDKSQTRSALIWSFTLPKFLMPIIS